MSENRDVWSPMGVVIFTLVSLALVGVLTGSVLVMRANRSASIYLAPLDVGAPLGSTVAVTCAAVVLLGSVFLRKLTAVASAGLLSGLLAALPAYAAFLTAQRAGLASEPPSDAVYMAQSLYLVASGFMAAATVVAVLNHRRRKRSLQVKSRVTRTTRGGGRARKS